MAKFSGYKCDGPKCSVTAEGPSLPPNWMALSVNAKVAGRVEVADAVFEREDFHLCSNLCLRRLAGERHHAAVERGDEKPTRGTKADVAAKPPRRARAS